MRNIWILRAVLTQVSLFLTFFKERMLQWQKRGVKTFLFPRWWNVLTKTSENPQVLSLLWQGGFRCRDGISEKLIFIFFSKMMKWFDQNEWKPQVLSLLWQGVLRYRDGISEKMIFIFFQGVEMIWSKWVKKLKFCHWKSYGLFDGIEHWKSVFGCF